MLCQLGRPSLLAIIKAEERGLADVLTPEVEPAPYVLSSVLTYCDMTTSPTLVPRQAAPEIHHHYGTGHPVSRSIQRATAMILRAVDQVHSRAVRTAKLC